MVALSFTDVKIHIGYECGLKAFRPAINCSLVLIDMARHVEPRKQRSWDPHPSTAHETRDSSNGWIRPGRLFQGFCSNWGSFFTPPCYGWEFILAPPFEFDFHQSFPPCYDDARSWLWQPAQTWMHFEITPPSFNQIMINGEADLVLLMVNAGDPVPGKHVYYRNFWLEQGNFRGISRVSPRFLRM